MVGVSVYFSVLPSVIEICDFGANSVDPGQTPRSAASDLGLHCLPMSLYGTPGTKGLIKDFLWFHLKVNCLLSYIHVYLSRYCW